MENEFFIFLPSNSSLDYFPDSTLTSYTVKLPDTIQLQGQYEVGLKELHYPRNWRFSKIALKVPEEDKACLLFRELNSSNKHLETYDLITSGSKHYENLDVLTQNINRKIYKLRTHETNALKGKGDIFPKLVFDNRLGRYVVYNDVNEEKGKYFQLNMSPALAEKFGFNRRQIGDYTSEDPLHIIVAENGVPNHSIDYLYVYCDLIEPSIVGNVRVPLLRIIDVRGKPNDVVSMVYETPLYFPLLRSSFDSVEILLRDDTGQPIPFEASSRVVAVLHVRKILKSI